MGKGLGGKFAVLNHLPIFADLDFLILNQMENFKAPKGGKNFAPIFNLHRAEVFFGGKFPPPPKLGFWGLNPRVNFFSFNLRVWAGFFPFFVLLFTGV